MIEDVLTVRVGGIRGADSNSLLRMYDAARGLSVGAPAQHDRERAERAVRRIARELTKRNVAFERVT